ncbi:MAG: hypothetical protein LBU07_06055 [Coriobacteriales bacterium]|jgi:hypothetical protein|nr:hypothetical protein [Coriobacteriales bacterium]
MSDEQKHKDSSNNLDLDLSQIIKKLDAQPERRLAQARRRFDPNATVAYSAVGESYPELPFAGNETTETVPKEAGGPKARQSSRRRTSVSRQSATGNAAGKVAAAGKQAVAGGAAEGLATAGKQAVAGGAADAMAATQRAATKHKTSRQSETSSTRTRRLGAGNATDRPSREQANEELPTQGRRSRQQTQGTQDIPSRQRTRSATGAQSAHSRPRTSRPTSRSASKPDDSPSTTGKTARAVRAGAGLASAQSSGAVGKTTRTTDNTRIRKISNPLDNSEIFSAPSSFKPIDIHRSTYQIRGGGIAQGRSATVTLLLALLVVAALIILGFGFFKLVAMLSSTGITKTSLTPTQTREAIDPRLPLLSNYVSYGMDDMVTELENGGQSLYVNARYQPDSPDPNAEWREVISMPSAMSTEQIQGFYEGSYNAYSLTELEQLFNGAYTLDMARGNLGSWNKLKYVNLSATSIDDEMTRLLSLQGLTGEGVTISAQGMDSRGNKVVQGAKAVGEQVYYYKVAACPFNEVYSASLITDNSVYISCTLANYDFYTGADTITSA